MGRYASVEICVGVEFDEQELRSWLMTNRKGYNDSDYGPNDLFQLVADWAGSYSINTTKPKPFASLSYDDKEVYNIFFGLKILDDSLNVYSEGYYCDETEPTSKVDKAVNKLKEIYPEKEAQLISILSCG
jgi:hypothetical protein